MMQECPKCGFSQPKDRYCANCGVDIDNFKPKVEPFFVRLAKNTKVQISAVVVAIFLMGAVIYFTQSEKLQQVREQYSTGALLETDTNDADATNTSATEPDSKSADVSTTVGDSTAEAETQPLAAAALSPTTTSGNKRLHVAFAEITKPLSMKILGENQVLSESAQTRIVLVTSADAESKYSDSANVFKLPGTEESNIVLNSSIQLDFTQLSPNGGEDVGMNMSFIPIRAGADMLEFEMSAIIMLKNEQGTSMTTTDVDTSFSFAPGNSIIILGVVPYQDAFEADLALFQSTPLNILSSSQFQSRLTEFAVFISVK